jgi:hypothetical protein
MPYFGPMTYATLSLLLALAGSQDTLPALTKPDPALLPTAKVQVDEKKKEIIVDLPGIPLPMHTGHHDGGGGYPPVVQFAMPVDAALYGFRVEVVDTKGSQLPPGLIHHFNLIDPNNRELFLPISRRVMAAGKETGAQRLPWFLFGVPYRKGDLLVASGMLHNPTGTDYDDVHMRLVLQYVPGTRPWPVFDGIPWQLDVAFPVGDKSFTLQPGISTRSYEANPTVAGKIIAVGGHVHEMATKIELIDVTENKVIWSAAPTLDKENNVVGVPIGKLYGFGKLGYPIRPDRKYRVTVTYNNTTGQPVAAGGMGVVGGLFVPESGVKWPAPNKADTLYLADAEHYLRVQKAKADSSEHQHEHEHEH